MYGSMSFSAVGQAVKLARSISRHPQQCLQADRSSAYHAMFQASNLQEAFEFELNNAMSVLENESVSGLSHFQIIFVLHGVYADAVMYKYIKQAK